MNKRDRKGEEKGVKEERNLRSFVVFLNGLLIFWVSERGKITSTLEDTQRDKK
jgi:hypothetical protein